MAKSINLIVVEDNEHDQIALQRPFRGDAATTGVTLFESAAPALEELAASPEAYDVLVADYDLPGMDGLTLCKTVAASHPHVALVILTGRGSESLAVEALKAGVDDYLTKDPEQGYLKLLPQVLANAVRRRWEARARLEAEEALRRSEARYRRLVENSPDIVYSFSSRSGCIYVSSGIRAVMGYSPEYLFENPLLWNESIHPEEQAMVAKAIADFAQGKPFSIEYRISDANGAWHWLWDRSIGREEIDGEVIIEGLATDITAIKRLSQQRENLIAELQRTLDQVKQLSGLLPICSNCKKIRDDQGYWSQLEEYFTNHSEAEFTHSICPDCQLELYPELFED